MTLGRIPLFPKETEIELTRLSEAYKKLHEAVPPRLTPGEMAPERQALIVKPAIPEAEELFPGFSQEVTAVSANTRATRKRVGEANKAWIEHKQLTTQIQFKWPRPGETAGVVPFPAISTEASRAAETRLKIELDLAVKDDSRAEWRDAVLYSLPVMLRNVNQPLKSP